jgi:Zn-dependent dipeptidase, microsomal dipeptidase homolog
METIKKIHEEAFVLDSHCDTPLRLVNGANISKKSSDGHVDFVRMKEGGVDASFFAIYTSNKLSPDESTRRALQLIAHTYDAIDNSGRKAALATNVAQARVLKSKGIRAIFLGMENGAPIQKDLSLLRLFYRMGIRYVTLTHAGNNEICDSCATKEKKWNGVSPFGRRVIAEMNKLGMLIDVSHISDDAFYDVLKYSKSPVVATHSCCRALSNHPRNMTDQMIKDLAAAGGVIQINFYPAFLSEEYAEKFWPLCDAYDDAQAELRAHPRSKEAMEKFKKAEKNMFALKRPSYKLLVDHIEHAVKLVGAEHVGLGTDFDGIETCPTGLEDISKMEILTEEMYRRGFNKEEIKLILGENFLRLLDKVDSMKCL